MAQAPAPAQQRANEVEEEDITEDDEPTCIEITRNGPCLNKTRIPGTRCGRCLRHRSLRQQRRAAEALKHQKALVRREIQKEHIARQAEDKLERIRAEAERQRQELATKRQQYRALQRPPQAGAPLPVQAPVPAAIAPPPPAPQQPQVIQPSQVPAAPAPQQQQYQFAPDDLNKIRAYFPNGAGIQDIRNLSCPVGWTDDYIQQLVQFAGVQLLV